MKSEQLKRGNELEKIISATEKSIDNIKVFIQGNSERNSDYNLNIARHSDGSGDKVNLSRHEGNTELLNLILQTLEKQLVDFKSEFDKL